MDVSKSHTSYSLKANKHVVTHSFEIYRIHFLELFHAAFAVRIEDTPNEVINFSKIRKTCQKTTIRTVTSTIKRKLRNSPGDNYPSVRELDSPVLNPLNLIEFCLSFLYRMLKD